MGYSVPEWEDLVFELLVENYKWVGKPIPASSLTRFMSKTFGRRLAEEQVVDALESLSERELIQKVGGGYRPATKALALKAQLRMEEVTPFTREPGEIAESHMDKVWEGDIRELEKPEAGGEYGLYPVNIYFNKDLRWKGLTYWSEDE